MKMGKKIILTSIRFVSTKLALFEEKTGSAERKNLPCVQKDISVAP